MPSQENPYLCPISEEEASINRASSDSWTTPRLVLLFFTPALFLLCLVAGLSVLEALHFDTIIPAMRQAFWPVVAIFTIGISILSASIQMRRQAAGAGTFLLFSLIYLIAEVLSLFLAIAGLIFLVR